MMTNSREINKFCLSVGVALILIGVPIPNASAHVWETWTDRPGNDIEKFSISHQKEAFVAVAQCEDACIKRGDCLAFTYVKPGVQGIDGVCYLKGGSIPPAVKDKCCTSGVVKPVSDSDKCALYAGTAVQQYKNNVAWGCGEKGPQWSDDYKWHYDWCTGEGLKEADKNTTSRMQMLMKCYGKVSTSGDLSAHDWCWERTDEYITFVPIIKNVGPEDWRSKKEGSYYVGVWGPAYFTEKKFALRHFPHWYIKQKPSPPTELNPQKLGGLKFPYYPEGIYNMENIWILSHPEDTNKANNWNPGIKGFFKGADFDTHPKLLKHKCGGD